MTEFLEMLMAHFLSHNIGIGSVNSTCLYFKVYFIHRICVQQVVAVIYSALLVEKERGPCFLLTHETKNLPRKKATPEVLFLS